MTKCILLQALAVEAGGTAAQPMEQAGITEDVIQKLQERATVLTQERKRRGRSVPEDLLPQDSIRTFHTLASHPVILLFFDSCNIFYTLLLFTVIIYFFLRVFIQLAFLVYLRLIYTVQTPVKS